MAPVMQFKVDVERYRKAAGITTLDLSDRTGIARTTLRRKLAQPGLFTLDELAAVTNICGIPDEAFEVIR